MLSLNAQLTYKSSGNFGLGTTNPLSTFSLGSDGYSTYTANIYSSGSTISRGLSIYHLPDDSNYNYGIVSSIGHNGNSWKLTGIYCSSYPATNTDDIYTYGVKAVAGRGHNGLNYGVMGKLIGDRKGAGIFGCDDDHNEIVLVDYYAGYFAGQVYVTGIISAEDVIDRSDFKAKKDIRSLGQENISKLSQLNAILYKLKHPTELTERNNIESDTTKYLPLDYPKYTKDRIGLIAQEVQEVYPELVGMDNEGYLTLNYIDLIPVLIEAIKEQQIAIEELANSADSDIGTKKSSSLYKPESTESNLETFNLLQNVPNPFNENTTIKYSIPSIESFAMINVYDLNGSQVKSYNVAQTGDGEIMIPAAELSPGLFIYNLIVDGIEVASKRMVLTE